MAEPRRPWRVQPFPPVEQLEEWLSWMREVAEPGMVAPDGLRDFINNYGTRVPGIEEGDIATIAKLTEILEWFLRPEADRICS